MTVGNCDLPQAVSPNAKWEYYLPYGTMIRINVKAPRTTHEYGIHWDTVKT